MSATVPNLSSGQEMQNVLDAESSPALTVFNNQLICAYQDTNSKTLRVATATASDGSNLTSGTDTGFSIRYAPAVAVWNGLLYIAFNERANNQWWITNSSDAINFSTPVQINLTGNNVPSGLQTQFGIGLVAYDEGLYFSFVANGTGGLNGYASESLDGVNFGEITCMACNMNVNYGASLATYNGNGSNQLVLTTTDNDGNLYSLNGPSGEGARYKYTPQGVQWNDSFYVFGRDWAESHNMFLEAYVPGSGGWQPLHRYGQTMNNTAGVTVFQNNLIVAARSNYGKNLWIYYAAN